MSRIDKAGLSQLIIALVAIITALIWPYAPLSSVSSPNETENGHGLSGLPPIIGVGMESEIGHRIEVVSVNLPLAPVLVLASKRSNSY